MFSAMRHGKAGRSSRDLPAGTSMRDLFRQTEDMLTGTVFERLSYLPGSEAWALLQGTFRGLPDRRMVEIVDIDFWPNWETDDDSRSWVQPDVLITIDLGDPPQKTLLLVEAKTADVQRKSQWEAQLRSLALRLEDGDNEEIVYYAALGGLKGMDADKVWNEVTPELRNRVRFVHADWSNLGKAIADRTPKSPETERLVEDISAALALYGYVSTRLSDVMFEIDRPLNPGEAMKSLKLGDTL